MSILVAIAATSRMRYKQRDGYGDGDAFKKFLQDQMQMVMPFPKVVLANFRKGDELISEILYNALRNNMIHEGGLPHDVQLRDTDEFKIRQEDNGIILAHSFVWDLANAVIQAKENAGVFPDTQNFLPPWLPNQ